MAAIAVQLENVSRLFGRFPALRQVSAVFSTGQCYVLLGENGAGKSTLLRVLAGLLQPTLGVVRYFPQPVATADPGRDKGTSGESEDDRLRAARARIGYMSHSPMIYDELSAAENLRYFASLYRGRPVWTPEEALNTVGLDPALPRPVGQYSQGMRQRVSLARVLLSQPELILLDEPFSNLDARSAGQMLLLLGRLRGEGRCVVLTTHQRDLAAPLADQILTMEAGRLTSAAPGAASAHATELESALSPTSPQTVQPDLAPGASPT